MLDLLGQWMPFVALASVVSITWIMWRRIRREAAFLFDDTPPATVFPGDDTLRVERADGTSDDVAWSELAAVRIRTTDEGPFVEDVFWCFECRDGRVVEVPGGAGGIDALLAVLEDRLPGFDFEAVIEAMASTDHAVFEAWSAT